jgi:hypothetical protein
LSRTLVFIPRFRLASSRRAARALGHALATVGGYSLALQDPSAAVDVFVDFVVFREPISHTTNGSPRGRANETEFARAMLESVGASFCVVLDGRDSYLTSNAQPLMESVLSGATQVVMGAVWRTHRPRERGRWPAPLHWLGKILARRARRDALSGLFVVEGVRHADASGLSHGSAWLFDP